MSNDKDRIELEFTWKEKTTASLLYLWDNGANIDLSGLGRARSNVQVEYTREAFARHTLEWALQFPGEKLTQLKATASLNGGPAKVIGESDSESHAWIGRGRIR